jgi:hypothetical protein
MLLLITLFQGRTRSGVSQLECPEDLLAVPATRASALKIAFLQVVV